MAGTSTQAHSLPPEAQAYTDYLVGRLGASRSARIVEWQLAAQGLSDETRFVTVADGDRRTNLVIRLYRSDGLLRGDTDPLRHFQVLAALGDSEIPVPAVLWYEDDESILDGPFFVMERVPGTVPIPWSPEGRTFLAEAGRGAIGRQFVEILAAIHRVDWSAELGFLPAPATGRDFAETSVRRLASTIEGHKLEPDPILVDALGYLRAHLPEADQLTLVHGDYRTGNLVYDDDGIAAVLDWEFATIGDPLLDVAWVCARSNRMDSELVCFLMHRERFLEAYEQASGIRPDAKKIHYWELYHQVRHTAIWMTAACAFTEGQAHDLRLARMAFTLPKMRRMIVDLLEET